MEERSIMDRLRDPFSGHSFSEFINLNMYSFLLRCENSLKLAKPLKALGIDWHNPEFEVKLMGFKPRDLKYIENQKDEVCMAAIQRDPVALFDVKKQTPEICMTAIKQKGEMVGVVKNQTPEICMAAVLNDPWSISYIKNPSLEVCMAALHQDPRVFDFIKNRPPEICLTTMERNNETILHVSVTTRDRFMSVLEKDSLDNLIGAAESKRVAPVTDAKNKTRESALEL